MFLSITVFFLNISIESKHSPLTLTFLWKRLFSQWPLLLEFIFHSCLVFFPLRSLISPLFLSLMLSLSINFCINASDPSGQCFTKRSITAKVNKGQIVRATLQLTFHYPLVFLGSCFIDTYYRTVQLSDGYLLMPNCCKVGCWYQIESGWFSF